MIDEAPATTDNEFTTISEISKSNSTVRLDRKFQSIQSILTRIGASEGFKIKSLK
jgi:hypothetical protein